ncbi:hypothetical protein FGO68_gene2971 [Halteria grandinella]|uniref:Uncharacterized protein n=1 Tax=Halteria grandinella TaxID=5974 RepID=A0A8J8NPE8_HALGN|nr:hypothetical protein FGO68_gene2971 [Halteria grandinella]
MVERASNASASQLKQRALIVNLKSQLRVQLLKSFSNHGYTGDSIITLSDTWFFKDLDLENLNLMETPGGPQSGVPSNMRKKGLLSTPKENQMGIHYQVFQQLKSSHGKQEGVIVNKYIEELILIMIDNFIIISKFKEVKATFKDERGKIRLVKDTLPKSEGVQSESKIGVKHLKTYLGESNLKQEHRYTVDVSIDEDTPALFHEISQITADEETDFIYMHVLLLSEAVLFTLRDKTQGKSKKPLAFARIDLKKHLYESLSITSFTHATQQLDYPLSFYDSPDALSQHDPQSSTQSPLLSMDLRLSLSFDPSTLGQILDFKERIVKQRESEAKFKVLHHAEVISDVLKPFEDVIGYSEESGFSGRDKKGLIIGGIDGGKSRDRCQVCDGCIIV